MAWHYARYMDHIATAGKAEYPLPVFTNTWLVQPEDKAPGDYPSGCPEPLTIDIWKAGAPSIDINAPDIHLRNFTDWAERFHRPNNPLFVPESHGDAGGAANAFFGIGQHAAIGYSPFGIDNAEHCGEAQPGQHTPAPIDVAKLPLARAYALLAQMTPLIVEPKPKAPSPPYGSTRSSRRRTFALGNYIVNVAFSAPGAIRRRRWAMPWSSPSAPTSTIIAGHDSRSSSRRTRRDRKSRAWPTWRTGNFVNGRWLPGRKLDGDDVVLDYDQAGAAAKNQSGSGLIFGPDGPIHSACETLSV